MAFNKRGLNKLILKYFNYHIYYWLFGFTLLIILDQALYSFEKINTELIISDSILHVYPLIMTSIIVITLMQNKSISKFSPYILFFSISATSLLGITNTMTGTISSNQNITFYGLSFYSTTMAYHAFHNNISFKSIPIASNPLLLASGPIPTVFKIENISSFKRRSHHYSPFIILGIFLHQGVATNLTPCVDLIIKTDLISTIVFAIIFEMLIYANFCGLSLIIYGVFGLIGVHIPLNFTQPFSSKNLVDFWRGWHRSLSTVLKSLFYIPFKNKAGSTVAIFIVFISSALWHGVTLNFILWGLFHSIMYITSLFLLKNKIKIIPNILFPTTIIIGRLIFSDSNTSRLLSKLMFKYDGFNIIYYLLSLPGITKAAIITMLSFIFLEHVLQKHPLFRMKTYKFYRIPSVQIVILFITILLISNNVGQNYAAYGQR